jgi:hypothetical protein
MPGSWEQIVIVALVALASPASPGVSWLNVVLGVWLFISPWVLRYTGTLDAAWNAWVFGVIAVIVAGWAGLTARRPAPGCGDRPTGSPCGSRRAGTVRQRQRRGGIQPPRRRLGNAGLRHRGNDSRYQMARQLPGDQQSPRWRGQVWGGYAKVLRRDAADQGQAASAASTTRHQLARMVTCCNVVGELDPVHHRVRCCTAVSRQLAERASRNGPWPAST